MIDLGPEGGHKGGFLVAAGTPEQIARASGSFTGQYLKKYFKNKTLNGKNRAKLKGH